jgi:hypothetical protein
LLRLSPLLLADDHFAVADDLFIQPELIFKARGFRAGPHRSAQQSHAGWRLKHVRIERAAIHVELNFQIPSVGNPRHLVAWIEHDYLRDKSYQYWAFCHFSSLNLFAVKTIAYLLRCGRVVATTIRRRWPLVPMKLSPHLSYSLLDPRFRAP